MEEIQQTKFHGAFFYTERLHRILVSIMQSKGTRSDNAADIIKNIREYYNLLNCLYSELSAKMTDAQRVEHFDTSTHLLKQVEIIKKEYNKTKKISILVYTQFDQWDVELRAFADKKGLIVPDKDSAAFAAYS